MARYPHPRLPSPHPHFVGAGSGATGADGSVVNVVAVVAVGF